jgi:hypothetical protein
MPLVANLLEFLDGALWDRVPLGMDPLHRRTHTTLFVEPISGEKSQLYTNLTRAGQLERPHRFVIKSARAALIGRDGIPLAADHSLWWNSIFYLAIHGKPYLELPLFELMDPQIRFFKDPREWMNIPIEQRKKFLETLRFTLTTPLVIDWDTPFSARLEHFVENPPDCDVLVVLEGELARAVQ